MTYKHTDKRLTAFKIIWFRSNLSPIANSQYFLNFTKLYFRLLLNHKLYILQARLELATSALLFMMKLFNAELLSYKYHALTNCATGDVF